MKSSATTDYATWRCPLPWASYQIRKIVGCACAGNVFPATAVSDPDMHHGTCVTHVPWCMSVSLTSGFLWRRWRGKRSRYSWRMRNPQFCVSVRRHVPTFHLHISQNKLPKNLLWELPLTTILNVQANVSIQVCMLPAMYLDLNWYFSTQTIITSPQARRQ